MDVFAGMVMGLAVLVVLLAVAEYREVGRRQLSLTVADPIVFYGMVASLAAFAAVLVLGMVVGNGVMVDLVSEIFLYVVLASLTFLVFQSYYIVNDVITERKTEAARDLAQDR